MPYDDTRIQLVLVDVPGILFQAQTERIAQDTHRGRRLVSSWRRVFCRHPSKSNSSSGTAPLSWWYDSGASAELEFRAIVWNGGLTHSDQITKNRISGVHSIIDGGTDQG